MNTDNLTADNHLNQQSAIPRPPFSFEKSELLSQLLDTLATARLGIDNEEVANANALVASASIAVFDAYKTDNRSGYAGKLMSVV